MRTEEIGLSQAVADAGHAHRNEREDLMNLDDVHPGDGIRDATEALLPGGQIAVVEIATGKPVQAYTTDGISEPHCFKGLPAGQYTVSFAAPAGYNPTTVTSTPLDVEIGVTKALEFGAQPSAAVANQPAARPSNTALLTALLFAGGVVFLLLAAGVAAFLFLRRPS